MSIEHSGRLDKEVGSSYVRGRNYKAERRRGMSVFYVMLTDCYRFDKIRGGRHGGLGQYLSYHRHISYNGRAPLRDPSFREAAASYDISLICHAICIQYCIRFLRASFPRWALAVVFLTISYMRVFL